MKKKGILEATFIVLITSYFLWFAYILIFSNYWDWDQQLSLLEIERRSWINDFHWPLWSYQLCGGVSRAGDPQSYGLSPLFLIPLIFGSFIGSKILVFFSSILGFWYLRKLLLLLGYWWLPNNDSSSKNYVATTLSLLTVFQNYFLWNFFAGHLVYLNVYLSFGVIYYLVYAYDSKLTRRDYVKATLLSICVFAGGIQLLALFILVPLFLFLILLVLPYLLMKKVKLRHELLKSWSFLGLGLLVASIKFYFIVSYQNKFPRVLAAHDPEFYDPTLLLKFLFVPTQGFRFWDGSESPGPWSIWEYSFFSPLNYLFIFFLFIRMRFSKTYIQLKYSQKRLLILWVVFGVLCVFLFLGEFSWWSPFGLLNRALFSNSIRAPVRYIFPFLLGIPFVLYFLILNLQVRKTEYLKYFSIALLIVGLCGFNSVSDLVDKIGTEKIWNLQNSPLKMRQMTGGDPVHMYSQILMGRAMVNCYQPLSYPFLFPEVGRNDLVDLIFDSQRKENPRCQQESYFTENDIVISPDCSSQVCVNLNAINIYKKSEFEFNTQKNRYCRKLVNLGK